MVFNYYHDIAWDLTRYNVFSSFEQEQSNTENDLNKALRLSGIPKVERFINHLNYGLSMLKACQLHRITVHCRYCNQSADELYTRWYNKGFPVYRIACVDGHFFVNDAKTGLTMYSLNHYNKIKNMRDWNKVTSYHPGYKARPYYQRRYKDDKRQINAFRVMKLLLRNKHALLTPAVKAEHLTTAQFSYICPHCGELHWHGNGDLPKKIKEPIRVHRVTHCNKGCVYVKLDKTTRWVRLHPKELKGRS